MCKLWVTSKYLHVEAGRGRAATLGGTGLPVLSTPRAGRGSPCSARLGRRAGPKERLDSTVVSQPAIYVASLAAVEQLRAAEGEARTPPPNPVGPTSPRAQAPADLCAIPPAAPAARGVRPEPGRARVCASHSRSISPCGQPGCAEAAAGPRLRCWQPPPAPHEQGRRCSSIFHRRDAPAGREP